MNQLVENLVPICLYGLNCTKFGQLIVRKIIEIVATRCQILRLKCTKFNFGWGSAPDPAGGAYSAPPDPVRSPRPPSHCESSPGSFDECRMVRSGRRPKTKPDDLGCESACTGCQNYTHHI